MEGLDVKSQCRILGSPFLGVETSFPTSPYPSNKVKVRKRCNYWTCKKPYRPTRQTLSVVGDWGTLLSELDRPTSRSDGVRNDEIYVDSFLESGPPNLIRELISPILKKSLLLPSRSRNPRSSLQWKGYFGKDFRKEIAIRCKPLINIQDPQHNPRKFM